MRRQNAAFYLFRFQIVSHRLSKADFVGLKGLVEENEIERIKNITEPMNAIVRSNLAALKEDVIIAFPYRVDISVQENDDDEFPKRFFVEIMMIFHAIKNYHDLEKNILNE